MSSSSSGCRHFQGRLQCAQRLAWRRLVRFHRCCAFFVAACRTRASVRHIATLCAFASPLLRSRAERLVPMTALLSLLFFAAPPASTRASPVRRRACSATRARTRRCSTALGVRHLVVCTWAASVLSPCARLNYGPVRILCRLSFASSHVLVMVVRAACAFRMPTGAAVPVGSGCWMRLAFC